MNTAKATYWIALAAFVLVLNSEYQQGKFPVLHQVADRAGSAMCRAATRAEQTLAMGRFLVSGTGRKFSSDPFISRRQAEIDRMVALHQAELDRVMALRQADLDRVQQRIDRAHTLMDRTQLDKLPMLQSMGVKFNDATNRRMVVICPETGARVAIDADTDSQGLDVDGDVQ